MLMRFLGGLALKNLNLQINSLGDPACRGPYRDEIQKFLRSKSEKLCEDCQRRLETNPLRVFDCKKEECQAQLAGAPVVLDFLCPDCRRHFEQVKSLLDELRLPYAVNPRMVRGLDYYTRTAFEVVAGDLGAQNAVCGGGRYDGLAEEIGGPSVPAIGFAIGVERLVMLLPEEKNYLRYPDVFLAALGEEAQRKGFCPGPGTARCRGLGRDRLRRKEPEKPDAQGRPVENPLGRHSWRRGTEEEQGRSPGHGHQSSGGSAIGGNC